MQKRIIIWKTVYTGCDRCGEDKISHPYKQKMGQWQRILLCEDCRPLFKEEQKLHNFKNNDWKDR